MVMHARKTQRMNDGYFEKHQTHPYQNSKYSSSKNSYGGSGERYERLRDSPNGNSYRSDSPDSQSPRDRDRTYQSKNSYIQKMREKERENRDYKVSRDKYSDCARSPKDKRNRDSEHRTNHDRSDDRSHQVSQSLSGRDRKPMHNNCLDKKEDRERVNRVGDWSEHISSSGKKYYYNCKTEVSQWEKPREWMDRERFRNKDRDRDSDRSYSRSGHDKHSNSRASNSKDNSSSRESATTGGSSRHWSSSNKEDVDMPSAQDSRRKHVDGDSQSTQDMDISPGDSTPTSEVSYGGHNAGGGGGPASQSADTSGLSVGPILLATALPRLVSQPPTTPTITSRQPAASAAATSMGAAERTSPCSANTPSIVPPPACVTTSNTPGPPNGCGGGGSMGGTPRLLSQMSTGSQQSEGAASSASCSTVVNDAKASNVHGNMRQMTPADNNGGGGCQAQQQPLHVETNHSSSAVADGPPTPTHSETPDCPDTRKAIPMSSPPSSSLSSSLQGVGSSLGALRPQGPSITPSLANHCRDDLVNHVRGWPADILEKQAQKLSEEAHRMGSIECSKVSAELKSARSIVRLTEIQATLQEQRILFLRQQIKMLEELKSQNSFMSDDS